MSQLAGFNSHHTWTIEMLRSDREFAVEFAKAALEAFDNPEDRAASLLALRDIAEAYGGIAKIAAEAGISRESLYRSLSAKGNPTLKTLVAVLKAVGLRLSVVPIEAKPAKSRSRRTAAA